MSYLEVQKINKSQKKSKALHLPPMNDELLTEFSPFITSVSIPSCLQDVAAWDMVTGFLLGLFYWSKRMSTKISLSSRNCLSNTGTIKLIVLLFFLIIFFFPPLLFFHPVMKLGKVAEDNYPVVQCKNGCLRKNAQCISRRFGWTGSGKYVI